MNHFVRALALAALFGAAQAEELRLPVIADTSIANDEKDGQDNSGRSSRLKLKGKNDIILFAVDTAALKGSLVDHAVLHMRGCDANMLVRKVGLSTVATPWREGSSDHAPGIAGDSCFKKPILGEAGEWAWPDSCFFDAIWGRGGTRWTQCLVAIDAERWYTIDVDGRLLEAYASGLAHGIAFSDDNGQTKDIHSDILPDTNHGENFFFSREEEGSAPYITATTSPVPASEAAAITVIVKPWPAGAGLTTGGLEISWPGPADDSERERTLGYRIRTKDGTELPRWLHPSVPPLGEPVRTLMRLQTPSSAVELDVEVVGRGGQVIASGHGAGSTSAAFAPVTLMVREPIASDRAGQPPANEKGMCWAAPDLVKINPINGNVLEENAVAYEGEAKGHYAEANPVWSGATKKIGLTAVRNEWTAFQIMCQNKTEAGDWSITAGTVSSADGHDLPPLRLSRLWYQKTGKTDLGWYADPMLPLANSESFHVPDARNAVPGQTNQAIYAELFVPKDAKPGEYTGQIVIANGGEPIALNLVVRVASPMIPDQAAFTYSMNAYTSPGDPYGPDLSEPFLAGERTFYVMSHEHRVNLAILGYSHSARFDPGIAWPLSGEGKDMKVSDWSSWDRRFGPLFDASAFADTSRAGVPYDHFYLPFMESYPTPMAVGYKWNDVVWEDHWKVAGPVESGFSDQYREQWIAVMRDFEKHVAEKRWSTKFQVYLNDKYYYKRYRDKKSGRGQGTSFWLLDEPMQADDYAALAFFGKLTRQAQRDFANPVLFRIDLSCPEASRDYLDRVVDLDVSGDFDHFRPLIEYWGDRHGQRLWTYGHTPPSPESAYGIVHQGLDLYSRGVDGYVPWLTLGNEQNWTTFAQTCVLYTGKPMGVEGACASLRLKAYRRSEQDIEYVRLLAQKLGMIADDPHRFQVAALLADVLKGSKKSGVLDAEGAVTATYADLGVEDFESLRRAVVSRLE